MFSFNLSVEVRKLNSANFSAEGQAYDVIDSLIKIREHIHLLTTISDIKPVILFTA